MMWQEEVFRFPQTLEPVLFVTIFNKNNHMPFRTKELLNIN